MYLHCASFWSFSVCHVTYSRSANDWEIKKKEIDLSHSLRIPVFTLPCYYYFGFACSQIVIEHLLVVSISNVFKKHWNKEHSSPLSPTKNAGKHCNYFFWGIQGSISRQLLNIYRLLIRVKSIRCCHEMNNQ